MPDKDALPCRSLEGTAGKVSVPWPMLLRLQRGQKCNQLTHFLVAQLKRPKLAIAHRSRRGRPIVPHNGFEGRDLPCVH